MKNILYQFIVYISLFYISLSVYDHSCQEMLKISLVLNGLK